MILNTDHEWAAKTHRRNTLAQSRSQTALAGDWLSLGAETPHEDMSPPSDQLRESDQPQKPASEMLVSVVIPAFNAERFIGETIESVLGQSHDWLEAIVVDDGSTDDTRRIVQAIAEKESRVRLLDQRNSGVSAARNAGAAIARGSFLMFLDADDTITPDSVSLKLARFSSNHAFGLVQCDHQTMDLTSAKQEPIYSFPYEGDVLDELLLPRADTSIFCMGSWLVKREVFQGVGGFDPELSNCADHEFLFRVASVAEIGRVPKVGFFYRIHPNSMHANIQLLERDLLAAYRKADQSRLFRSPMFRRQCFANMYFTLAGSWWRNGKNKWRGAKYILLSIITYPPIVLRVVRKLSFGRLI